MKTEVSRKIWKEPPKRERERLRDDERERDMNRETRKTCRRTTAIASLTSVLHE